MFRPHLAEVKMDITVTPKVMVEHSAKSAYETRNENWPETVWRVARKEVST
jgi:hypothetical protein